MKKILLGLGLSVALLAGCGHKKTETNSNAADKKEISNNLPIIDNAKQQEVITRTLVFPKDERGNQQSQTCLLYTSPSPRDLSTSRMPSSA